MPAIHIQNKKHKTQYVSKIVKQVIHTHIWTVKSLKNKQRRETKLNWE